MPAIIHTIMILCTDGAFEQKHMLKVLIAAGTQNAKYIPILVTDSFRFPTKDFLSDNRLAIESVTDDPAATAKLISDVFKSVAVVFDPHAYSSTEEALATKADEVAGRCLKQHLLKELSLKDGHKMAL